jgi:hypothetical protein
LTEPEVVSMTEQQRRQAMQAMSALILSWLQRRQHERAQAGKPASQTPLATIDQDVSTLEPDHGNRERRARGNGAGVRML